MHVLRTADQVYLRHEGVAELRLLIPPVLFERRRQQRRRAAALAHPGHVQTQEMFVPLNAVARSALGPQVALAALAAMSP